MGFMEMGRVTGGLAGVLLGYSLHQISRPEALILLHCPSSLASAIEQANFPVAVLASLGFDVIGMVAASGVLFRADVPWPATATKTLASFLHDSKAILKDKSTWGSLLGLSYFMGVIMAGLLASALTLRVGMEHIPTRSVSADALVRALLLLGFGAAAGCLLAGLQNQSYRIPGLVPPAASGLAAVLVWAAVDPNPARVYPLLGLLGGLILVPLRTAYSAALPAEARGNGMAMMSAVNCLSVGIAASLVLGLESLGILMPPGQFWLLAGLTALGALLAWRFLRRETIELLGEALLSPMYRVHVRGLGIDQLPLHGPLLVIANHAAWFDPLWLAKVLPRPVTPMMTSRFFDLPVLHWLMSDVAGAIRVEEAAYRREAPELQEAVAVLDRGGCLLLFPEGALKRHPEQSLRRFGQGVWRILRQRPQTPVVACWIEGGWGSFTSYCGGPPTVNKHLDRRRPIAIGIQPPQVLDQALFASRHRTREYLMRACLAARRCLGLEPLPLAPPLTNQPDSNAQYEKA
jgi:1-acyl-sn-glycerol-3-phosphate acyltransferase